MQAQTGLPYSVATSSGSPARDAATGFNPYGSGVGGTGVASFIPFFGRNQLNAPRNIVIDTRLQKDFRVREGMSLQLLAEGFNLANHRNITGVNSGAFTIGANNVLTATTNFGTPSSSGVNGNYAYQVRQSSSVRASCSNLWSRSTRLLLPSGGLRVAALLSPDWIASVPF